MAKKGFKSTMRLGPTFKRPPRLTEPQRLSCSKCKAEFSSLQVIKINDKQLCIWCAAHPTGKPSASSFTIRSQDTSSTRRVLRKVDVS